MSTIIGKEGTYYGLMYAGDISNPSALPAASFMAAVFTGKQIDAVYEAPAYTGQEKCNSINQGGYMVESAYYKSSNAQQNKMMVLVGKLDAQHDRIISTAILLQPGQDPVSNGKAPKYFEYVSNDVTSAVADMCSDGAGNYFVKIAFSDVEPS